LQSLIPKVRGGENTPRKDFKEFSILPTHGKEEGEGILILAL